MLSPIIAAISGDVALCFSSIFTNSNPEFGWVSVFIALVAYPVVLLAGIPLFMLMRHKNWLSPRAFILSGLFLALIAIVIVIAKEQHLFVGEEGTGNIAGLLLLAAVSGLVGGLTFMKLSGSDAQAPQ